MGSHGAPLQPLQLAGGAQAAAPSPCHSTGCSGTLPLARQLSPWSGASPQAQALAATLQSAQKQRVRVVHASLAALLATPPLLPLVHRRLSFQTEQPSRFYHSPLAPGLFDLACSTAPLQELAESTLSSLHATAAAKGPSPPPGGASSGGKENAAGFQRVSPGHFVLQHQHPQQQWGPSASAVLAVPARGAAAPLGEGCGQAAGAAASTPVSQQGSHVSSVLVDQLNYALRALGAPGECR